MANFKPGDVVNLKSDIKIKMTVESVETHLITCVWFDKTNQKRGSFTHETIQHYVNQAGTFKLR